MANRLEQRGRKGKTSLNKNISSN